MAAEGIDKKYVRIQTATSKSSKAELDIKTLTGKTITVSVDLGSTIEQLKWLI
jgi:hypothetical protein